MALTIYTDKDCKSEILKSKHIGILGFGAQGKAQAQNLRDSGYQVSIGLKDGSPSYALAQEMGFEVCDIATLAHRCDMLVFLLPDEWHKTAFEQISPLLTPHQILCFAHGFSIHFQEIIPPPFIDVIMVSPKGAGYAVRDTFLQNKGIVSLIAVHQDASCYAQEIALEYACGLGSGRSAILSSTFKDECECDLFSEQSVICGGISALVQMGFEVLTQAGYPAEIAYFECLHELKIIADLIHTQGLEGMRRHISNTAEYGDLTAGKLIAQDSKKTMEQILERIQNGEFAKEFLKERDRGFPTLKQERKNLHDCELEKTGLAMRKLMPWLKP